MATIKKITIRKTSSGDSAAKAAAPSRTAMGTKRDERSTLVKEATGLGVTLYAGLSKFRSGHGGEPLTVKAFWKEYRQVLEHYEILRYRSIIERRGFITEPKKGTDEHRLWTFLQTALFIPKELINVSGQSAAWFATRYGGADGFDKRWMQPAAYPKNVNVVAQYVPFVVEDGEMFVTGDIEMFEGVSSGASLFSVPTYSVRPVDPNIFMLCNAAIADVGTEALSTFYASGKGTPEIFWTSLVRNVKVHPMSKVGTKGTTFSTLARSAFVNYNAATSAEERRTPSAPFDLAFVVGNFIANYNPDARSGPIWMSCGDLRKFIKTLPPGKGIPKVGDMLQIVIGNICRIWKRLKLPVDGYEDLLAEVEDVEDDEWLMLQSAVLVGKDEKLPLAKLIEKMRLYGIFDPSFNAIQNAFNKYLSNSVPTVLDGGHKGPGANYESKTGPEQLLGALMSDGLGVFIMGDDGAIKYVDNNQDALLINIDYTACDFSLTFWEVYGTMRAELYKVPGMPHEQFDPLVRTLALHATTGPIWVNGVVYTRRQGMISGVGGTSDYDRRVVLHRIWHALQLGGYVPGCNVKDIDIPKVEAALKGFGTMKQLQVSVGRNTRDFYINNFDWISHRFQPRPDDASKVAFLPDRDKLMASLYAHTGKVEIGADPMVKGARALGLAIQFPEYADLYRASRWAFNQAVPSVEGLRKQDWEQLERRLHHDLPECDTNHINQMMALLKSSSKVPSRDQAIQLKYDGKPPKDMSHTEGYAVEFVGEGSGSDGEETDFALTTTDHLSPADLQKMLSAVEPVASVPININVMKQARKSGSKSTKAVKTKITVVDTRDKPITSDAIAEILTAERVDQAAKQKAQTERKAKRDARRAQIAAEKAEQKKKVDAQVSGMLRALDGVEADGASHLPAAKPAKAKAERRPVEERVKRVNIGGTDFELPRDNQTVAELVLEKAFNLNIYHISSMVKPFIEQIPYHKYNPNQEQREHIAMHAKGPAGAFQPNFIDHKVRSTMKDFRKSISPLLSAEYTKVLDEFDASVDHAAETAEYELAELRAKRNPEWFYKKALTYLFQAEWWAKVRAVHRTQRDTIAKLEKLIERIADASVLSIIEDYEADLRDTKDELYDRVHAYKYGEQARVQIEQIRANIAAPAPSGEEDPPASEDHADTGSAPTSEDGDSLGASTGTQTETSDGESSSGDEEAAFDIDG